MKNRYRYRGYDADKHGKTEAIVLNYIRRHGGRYRFRDLSRIFERIPRNRLFRAVQTLVAAKILVSERYHKGGLLWYGIYKSNSRRLV